VAVSSNVLTHFTNKIENLENILTNNFIPKLCKENCDFFPGGTRERLIPMVCFCDIPLHLIHEHISDYGSYGLGLSKTWGINNGLNPIVYLEKETLLSKSFGEIFDNLPEVSDTLIERNARILENFWKIFCLLKPYQGIGKFGKEKIFYEENEWRYIPKSLHKNNPDGEIIGLNLFNDECTDSERNKIENILKEEPLKFDPGDIRYIFIDNESERMEIIEMVKRIKSPKYSLQQIDILCSKIISYDQFGKDV
jgi:hypothetical protein